MKEGAHSMEGGRPEAAQPGGGLEEEEGAGETLPIVSQGISLG